MTRVVAFVTVGVNTYRHDVLDVTVRVLGRTGISYERLGRSVKVDSEVLVDGMAVSTRGLGYWSDATPITPGDRKENAVNIASAIFDCCPGEKSYLMEKRCGRDGNTTTEVEPRTRGLWMAQEVMPKFRQHVMAQAAE